MCDTLFAPTAGALTAFRAAIDGAADLITRSLPNRSYSGRTAGELADLLDADPLPAAGGDLAAELGRLRPLVENSVLPGHPDTVAHLHCAPLIAALAAEVLISALNQSLDSFDQAPAATVIEQRLVSWLCREVGLPAGAAGAVTPGGTLSNYTALLLARDAWCRRHLGWDPWAAGLPPEAATFRILCSEAAHFSVRKSAIQLGLGTDAVVPVAVDAEFRMCPVDLARQLERVRGDGQVPIAVVATAGTTDFGSIDPLPAVTRLGRAAGAWVHVDAAYGGAALFSRRHRAKLDGIAAADSVTLDFHKLFWQPIGCSAVLVRDEAAFEAIRVNADYLNPEEHERDGVPDLVTRSLLTTRRFDALKLWLSLRVLGREKLGAMIDHTFALAADAAALIDAHPDLDRVHTPALGCVVFRYRGPDAVNDRIRKTLFNSGRAVIGYTRVGGRTCLKFTVLNPTATRADFERLLGLVVETGRAASRERGREPVAEPGAELLRDCRLQRVGGHLQGEPL